MEQNTNDSHVRNSLVLISGSILIVFSAIVFLFSTWNVISDIVKLITLVLLMLVFFGASFIAKKVFDLPNAAKAFYYIAMLYIPIIIIAIYYFKLLGNYLSFQGEGGSIYYAAATILLSIIYIFEYIKHRMVIGLGIGSSLIALLSTAGAVASFQGSGPNAVFPTINTYFLTIVAFVLIINIISLLIKNDDYHFSYFALAFNILLIVAALNYLGFSIVETFAQSDLLIILNYSLLILTFLLLAIKRKGFKILFNFTVILTVPLIVSNIFRGLSINQIILVNSLSTIILYTANLIMFKKTRYKIAIGIFLFPLVASTLSLLKLDDCIVYAPIVISLLLFLFESIKKDDNFRVFNFFAYGISLAILSSYYSIHRNIVTLIALIASVIFFIIYRKYRKVNTNVDLIPLIICIPALVPPLFSRTENIFISAIPLTIVTIILIIASLFRKEKTSNAYTVMAPIYCIILLFLETTVPSTSIIETTHVKISFSMIPSGYFKYIPFGLFTLWGLLHTLKFKDLTIYKVFFYIGLSILYLSILFDVGILASIIFIIFLLAMVVLGYYKKKTIFFVINLVTIIITFIKLTYDFWLNLPWWAYMLIVGIALIIFAIINEVKEKKNKDVQ